jgi:hypothetical protein
MLSHGTSSNLSEAILTANRIEKNFFKTQYLTFDRDRNKIRSNLDRHMETFLQITRKRHETWHRHDKYFREALKKEKDRHEKRKERLGSSTQHGHMTSPSLITINSRQEPMTKVERRTYQVLQASQKLLNESATKSSDRISSSRPSTTPNIRKASARSSSTFNSSSLIVPMTQSIDFDEYKRLTNESLKRETYSDFVEHFIKFRPEFREQFAYSHLITKRQGAVEKIRKFNQTYAKTKDQRYHNLIESLTDFGLEKKSK